MIDWDSPTWGRNPVHVASDGSYVEPNEQGDEA